MMTLSIVIPTYKETERLNQTLTEILPCLERRYPRFEIVVVDDPGRDGTHTILRAPFATDERIVYLRQGRRYGKGAAVKRGGLAAHGDVILVMDADHSTPIDEIDRFLPHFAGGEVRMVAGVRVFQEDESRWRRIVGLGAQLFLHLALFKKTVADSQCGFKAFSRSVVRALFPLLRVNGGMVDAEILYLMQKSGRSIIFEPVRWKNKPGSKISVLACLVRDPIEILKVRLSDLLGFYRIAEATETVPVEASPSPERHDSKAGTHHRRP